MNLCHCNTEAIHRTADISDVSSLASQKLNCKIASATTIVLKWWGIIPKDQHREGKGGKEHHSTSMAHSLYGYDDALAARPTAGQRKFAFLQGTQSSPESTDSLTFTPLWCPQPEKLHSDHSPPSASSHFLGHPEKGKWERQGGRIPGEVVKRA